MLGTSFSLSFPLTLLFNDFDYFVIQFHSFPYLCVSIDYSSFFLLPYHRISRLYK